MARLNVLRRESVTCHDCRRVFNRADHLQRHLLTHSDISAHECPRCQRPFKRKDALTRHLTSCPRVAPLPLVNPERACFRCAKQKIPCDHGIPSCWLCVETGYLCQYPVQSRNNEVLYATYGHVVTSAFVDSEVVRTDTLSPDVVKADVVCMVPARNISTPPTLRDAIAPDESESAYPDTTIDRTLVTYRPPLPPATSFGFLIRFTAQYSLAGCFSALDNAQSVAPVYTSPSFDARHLAETPDQGFYDWTATHSIMLSSVDLDEYFPLSSDSQSQRLICDTVSPASADPLSRQMQTFDCVALRSQDICSALQKFSSYRSNDQEGRCLEFFSPSRISSALDLYWSMWHPNWPVIHRPSFRIDDTPAPLLAAMVIIGSCHSDLDDARQWFDAVEDLAFDTLQSSARGQETYRTIQSIQAAYLTCIYQTWDGGEVSRMRIQRHRFRDIVTAVRELDMPSFRHDMTTVTNFERFDWPTFVKQEESIRTLLWVFLLDTAYVIFNNVPPQFALRELSMGLASCEASFQASSSQECFDCLHSWLSHNPRATNLTLYGFIRMFFRKQLSESIVNNLAHESFMNLWCVLGAFHVILFNLDPSLGGENQLLTLRTGIDTWRRVWSQRMRNNDEHFFDLSITIPGSVSTPSDVDTNTGSWKRAGFWKNAAEYWLLAHVILERMALAHESAMAADELSGMNGLHLNLGSHVHNGVAHADMRNIHSFLLAVDVRAY